MFISLLSASIAFILLLSLVSFFFLPFVLPLGMDVVQDGFIDLEGERDVFDFTALKVACTFPLYHPFYQSIRYSFMQPIINTSALKLMIEVFPGGVLGDNQQVLKGVSTGAIEMTLISTDDIGEELDVSLLLSDLEKRGGSLLNRHLSAYMTDTRAGIDPDQVQVIGLVEGSMRTLWMVNTDSARGSRLAALTTPTRRFDPSLDKIGYTPGLDPPGSTCFGGSRR